MGRAKLRAVTQMATCAALPELGRDDWQPGSGGPDRRRLTACLGSRGPQKDLHGLAQPGDDPGKGPGHVQDLGGLSTSP
jgi:hypothetical protein